ncbi:MAG: hypothetical protein R3C11_24465 [Planctomycetaceae bacterium]
MNLHLQNLLESGTINGTHKTKLPPRKEPLSSKRNKFRVWGRGLLKAFFSVTILSIGFVTFTILSSTPPSTPLPEKEEIQQSVEVASIMSHEDGITFQLMELLFLLRNLMLRLKFQE